MKPIYAYPIGFVVQCVLKSMKDEGQEEIEASMMPAAHDPI